MLDDATLTTDSCAIVQQHSETPSSAAAKGIAGAAAGLHWLACAGVASMCVATVYDVLARYVFNSPTSWATEISTYVLICVIFFGAAHTHLLDGHVRVELVLLRLADEARRALLVAAAWIGWLVVSIAAWQASLMVLSDYRNGSRIFSLLLTPTWLPKLPIAIGLAMLSAAILVEVERLAPTTRSVRWQRAAPYALGSISVVALLSFGTRPPLLGETRYDLGSLLLWLIACAGA